MHSVGSPHLPHDLHQVPHAVADDWAMLRGTIAVGFGLLALIWPSITLGTLTMLFGAYALIDGLFAGIAGLSVDADDADDRRWLAAIGFAGLLTGVATFLWPPATEVALLHIIAAWAIVTGTAETVGGIQLRRDHADGWLLVAGGAVSVILGAAMLALPEAAATALVWIIGMLAILVGFARVIVAVHMRRQSEAAPGVRDRVEFW